VPLSELMAEGVTLMLLGMGIVFVFLVVLVVALRVMSKLAALFDSGRGLAAEHEAVALTPTVPAHKEDERQLTAVISAAIARYRGTKR